MNTDDSPTNLLQLDRAMAAGAARQRVIIILSDEDDGTVGFQLTFHPSPTLATEVASPAIKTARLVYQLLHVSHTLEHRPPRFTVASGAEVPAPRPATHP